MKYFLTASASIFALSLILTPAIAQDTSGPKGPPKTMGDEGKLPATGIGSDKVPDMGATEGSAATGAGAAGPKGPPKTMGDEGKLPATGIGSDKVPQMRGNSSTGD